MKELEGHWYTFGIGSDGAKSAMEEFKTKYEGLLALHTDAGKEQAHNLLTGTLKTAQKSSRHNGPLRPTGTAETAQPMTATRRSKR